MAKPGAVELVNLVDGTVQQTIQTGTTNACISISGDGKSLATSSKGSRYISIFDLESGNKKGSTPIPTGANNITLNHDASLVAVSLQAQKTKHDERAVVFNTSSGKAFIETEIGGTHVFAFHPNNESVLIGAFQNYFTCIRINNSTPIMEGNKRVTSLGYSPDGKTLAITTWDGYLQIHDSETGNQINTRKAFLTRHNQMAWASNDHLITHAQSESGWLTQLWSTDGLSLVKSIHGAIPLQSTTQDTELPAPWKYDRLTGKLIFSGRQAGLVRLPIGGEHQVIPVENGGASLTGLVSLSVLFPTDQLLLSSGRPKMTMHDISTTAERREFDSILKGAIATTHHDHGLVAQAGRFNGNPAPLRMFRVKEGELEHRFDKPLKSGISNLSFSQSGHQILTLPRYGNHVDLYSTSDGSLLNRFRSPTSQFMIRAILVGEDENVLITMRPEITDTGEETSMYLLNSKNGSVIKELTVEQRVTSTEVSKDGSIIAMGISDGSIHLHQSNDLKFIKEIRVHDSAVTCLAFHPKANQLATSSTDLSVKIWDYQADTMMNQFLGISSPPNDLAFSPSGELLAVIDRGEFVHIWKSDTSDHTDN